MLLLLLLLLLITTARKRLLVMLLLLLLMLLLLLQLLLPLLSPPYSPMLRIRGAIGWGHCCSTHGDRGGPLEGRCHKNSSWKLASELEKTRALPGEVACVPFLLLSFFGTFALNITT